MYLCNEYLANNLIVKSTQILPMKKILLFTISLTIMSVLSARPLLFDTFGSKYVISADTLELYDTLGNKINNKIVVVSGSNPSVDALVGYIRVKNTTTTNLNHVFVRRVVNQEVANTTNSFCFGVQCYPPWVNESTAADTIKAGATDNSFYADYYPDGHGGLTSVTYEFFDNITFGTPVSAKATIDFLISAAGFDENNLVFKGPYPNPSSQVAHFEYNIPSVNSARLIIRNMLGVQLENQVIETGNGKKSIDVSGYASGIYFYSLIIDGKTVQSKKMVVRH